MPCNHIMTFITLYVFRGEFGVPILQPCAAVCMEDNYAPFLKAYYFSAGIKVVSLDGSEVGGGLLFV